MIWLHSGVRRSNVIYKIHCICERGLFLQWHNIQLGSNNFGNGFMRSKEIKLGVHLDIFSPSFFFLVWFRCMEDEYENDQEEQDIKYDKKNMHNLGAVKKKEAVVSKFCEHFIESTLPEKKKKDWSSYWIMQWSTKEALDQNYFNFLIVRRKKYLRIQSTRIIVRYMFIQSLGR